MWLGADQSTGRSADAAPPRPTREDVVDTPVGEQVRRRPRVRPRPRRSRIAIRARLEMTSDDAVDNEQPDDVEDFYASFN